MHTLRSFKEIVRQLFTLAKWSCSGPRWQVSMVLCAIFLATSLAGVYIGTLFITWNKTFFDALRAVDIDATLYQVTVFFFLKGASAGLHLGGSYVRKLVFMRWRQRLNGIILDAWLSHKTYWRLQAGVFEDSIDNPDQRIADDCRLFVDGFLDKSIDLITRVVALFTYLWVLWSLSSYSLEFSVAGLDIVIPHYMVWTAFLYVAVSTVLTHLLGAPLKNLLFTQQQREADYRFSLSRVRNSVDAIALADGENAERRTLDRRFEGIIDNWHRVIGREFILGCFTRPYFQTVLRVPLFFALPAYLAGQLTFGGLMQVSSAFGRVVNTLSWFIFTYQSLAAWVATINRLSGFLDVAQQAKTADSEISFTSDVSNTLTASDLVLRTPEGEILRTLRNFSISSGEHIWLNGPSGVGKSTMLKALAGLWMHGSGDITRPQDWHPAFAAQDPYLPLANLAASAAYPEDPTLLEDGQLRQLMIDVGLGHRAGDLNENSSDEVLGLSGGEKQRLMMVRLLIAKPDWVFLDEATSALDQKSEQHLLNLLFEELPDATIIWVSHHAPQVGENWRELNIG